MTEHVRELQAEVQKLAKGTAEGAAEDAVEDAVVSDLQKKREVERQWDAAAESLRRVAITASASRHPALAAPSVSIYVFSNFHSNFWLIFGKL